MIPDLLDLEARRFVTGCRWEAAMKCLLHARESGDSVRIDLATERARAEGDAWLLACDQFESATGERTMALCA